MTDIPEQWHDDGSAQVVPPLSPNTTPTSPEWYDDDAGPLVRLYVMTAGRARPTSEAFDLAAIIQASEVGEETPPPPSPEHAAISALCQGAPKSVADIAADSDLPVGVLRVLLDDLLEAGYISVSRPIDPAKLPGPGILREVIDGLRAL